MVRIYGIEDGCLRPLAADPAQGLPPGAVWIDLVRPDAAEVLALARALGVAIPSRAEVSGIQTSGRLVARDGTLAMSALIPADPHATPPATSPVTFVRTGERLLTVRYDRPEALDPFLARCDSGQELAEGVDALFAALLETLVDLIADRLEQAGDELDRLAHAIFHAAADSRRRRRPIARRTERLERAIERIGTAHELVSKLRECVHSLVRLATFADGHAADGLRPRLQAIATDLHAVAEYDTYLADHMQFMLDATVGLIDIQQNKVIYLLSIVSVVLTPPVLVASIYGMNFHTMPELAWPFGYAWGLGLMLVSAIAPWLFFRRRGWL